MSNTKPIQLTTNVQFLQSEELEAKESKIWMSMTVCVGVLSTPIHSG